MLQPGDFVEYDSSCSKQTLRGVLTCIGSIGVEPVQPRYVAFVDAHDGRAPLMVATHRLRKAQGLDTWLQLKSRAGDAA